MDKLCGAEECFYKDQLTARECRLSEELDIEYQLELNAQIALEAENKERYEDEISFALGDDITLDISHSSVNEIECNQSVNRSGLSRNTVPMNECGTQTNDFLLISLA